MLLEVVNIMCNFAPRNKGKVVSTKLTVVGVKLKLLQL